MATAVAVLALPLLALGGAAGAGESAFVPLHGFDPVTWSVRGYDCSGARDDTVAEFTLPYDPDGWDGEGHLTVDAPEGLGGLFRTGRNDKLSSLWVIGATTESSSAPRVQWRIELSDRVLTSDPMPFGTTVHFLAISDATFHDGDWTGSIDDWIEEFGVPHHWVAGALTGGCLGSDSVGIDRTGAIVTNFNLEPSTWVEAYRPWRSDGPVAAGAHFRLRATVTDMELETAAARPVSDARVDLERRIGKAGRWVRLRTRTTSSEGTAWFRPTAVTKASYRLTWRGPDGTVRGRDDVPFRIKH